MEIRQTLDRTTLTAAAIVAAMLIASPASAQLNQEILMQWMDVTIVHYAVVGDYEGEEMVVNTGTNGIAKVKDHVELGFDYDITNGMLAGTPTFTDSTTQMEAIRNGAESCRAPTISGSYEHSTIESLQDGFGGQLAMMVRTDYPAAQMTVACTGGNEAVAAHYVVEQEDFIVPGVMMLAMGAALTGDDLKVAADGKSFIVKNGGWTYVYTPSKVR